MGKYNKEEKSWMLYDWASSAYSIIITTAIFPIYFKSVADNAGVNQADSTAYFSNRFQFRPSFWHFLALF